MDVGSAVDFYNRLNRTASLVEASDLPGFSHRESAQITGILLASERGRLPRKYRRSGLLSTKDRERVGQAARDSDDRRRTGAAAAAGRFG